MEYMISPVSTQPGSGSALYSGTTVMLANIRGYLARTMSNAMHRCRRVITECGILSDNYGENGDMSAANQAKKYEK